MPTLDQMINLAILDLDIEEQKMEMQEDDIKHVLKLSYYEDIED